MNKCSQGSPEHLIAPPEMEPVSRVYTDEGQQWPFFNRHNLTNVTGIEEIDLEVLRKLEPRPPIVGDIGRLASLQKDVLYVLEAAEGRIDDNHFANIYMDAIRRISNGYDIDGIALVKRGDEEIEIPEDHSDKLDYLYEALMNGERQRPRVPALLEQCNRKEVFTKQQYFTVMEHCIFAASVRNDF